MPDLFGVLADGAVGGELGGAGYIYQALSAEGQTVGIVPVGTELCLQIAVILPQEEVVVGLVPGGAVQQGMEQLSLVIGFDREVGEDEITVLLDGTPARLTAPTDIGRIYAESTVRFDGVTRVGGLYLFSLPDGCTAGDPILSVGAKDGTLSLSYIEILIGDLPTDEASKGVRK